MRPRWNTRVSRYARGIVTGGTLFEELGFYYIGPVDGHDLENLVPILENLRDTPSNKPVLLHLKTEKGYGYQPAMTAGGGAVPRRAPRSQLSPRSISSRLGPRHDTAGLGQDARRGQVRRRDGQAVQGRAVWCGVVM